MTEGTCVRCRGWCRRATMDSSGGWEGDSDGSDSGVVDMAAAAAQGRPDQLAQRSHLTLMFRAWRSLSRARAMRGRVLADSHSRLMAIAFRGWLRYVEARHGRWRTRVLADGHFRRAALRRGVRRWRARVVTLKGMRALMAKAEARHAVDVEGRALGAWREALARRRELRAALQKADAAANVLSKRRCLTVWRTMLVVWAGQRAAISRADSLRAVQLSRRVFDTLASHVDARRHKRASMAAAACLCDELRAARGLARLRRHWIRSKHFRRTSALAASLGVRHQLRTAWWAWAEYHTDQQRKATAMQRAVAHEGLAVHRRALRRWFAFVRVRTIQRFRAIAADRHYSISLLRRGLAAMKHFATRSAALRAARVVAAQYYDARLCRRALDGWVRYCGEHYSRRLERCMMIRSLRALRWHAATRSSVRSAYLAADMHANRVLCRRVLHAFVYNASERARQRYVATLADTFRYMVLVGGPFQWWSSVSRASAARRRRKQAATEFRERRLCRRVFDSWLCRRDHGRRLRVAAQHFRWRQLQVSMRRWLDHHTECVLQCEQESLAHQHWASALRARCISLWRQYVRHRQERHRSMANAVVHFDNCSKRRAIRRLLLRVRASKRLINIGCVIRERHAALLSRGCMHLWRGFVADCRAHSDRLEKVADQALARRNRNVLASNWQAWVETHRSHMVHAIAVSLARGHYTRRLGCRVIRRWREWVGELRMARLNEQRAVAFDWARLIRAAFARWCDRHEELLVHRAKVVTAVRHWARRTTAKVWHAWLDHFREEQLLRKRARDSLRWRQEIAANRVGAKLLDAAGEDLRDRHHAAQAYLMDANIRRHRPPTGEEILARMGLLGAHPAPLFPESVRQSSSLATPRTELSVAANDAGRFSIESVSDAQLHLRDAGESTILWSTSPPQRLHAASEGVAGRRPAAREMGFAAAADAPRRRKPPRSFDDSGSDLAHSANTGSKDSPAQPDSEFPSRRRQRAAPVSTIEEDDGVQASAPLSLLSPEETPAWLVEALQRMGYGAPAPQSSSGVDEPIVAPTPSKSPVRQTRVTKINTTPIGPESVASPSTEALSRTVQHPASSISPVSSLSSVSSLSASPASVADGASASQTAKVLGGAGEVDVRASASSVASAFVSVDSAEDVEVRQPSPPPKTQQGQASAERQRAGPLSPPAPLRRNRPSGEVDPDGVLQSAAASSMQRPSSAIDTGPAQNAAPTATPPRRPIPSAKLAEMRAAIADWDKRVARAAEERQRCEQLSAIPAPDAAARKTIARLIARERDFRRLEARAAGDIARLRAAVRALGSSP